MANTHIHWARVQKLISDQTTKSMAVYELREKLKLKDQEDFDRLDDVLKGLGKRDLITVCMGKSETGMVCRIASKVQTKLSRRDRVGQ